MTDPQPAPASTPGTPSPASGLWAKLSPGEQFVLGGAVLILIGDILFATLLGGGGLLTSGKIGAAWLILMVILEHTHGRSISWPGSYGVLMIAIVAVLAVPALEDLLFVLRNLSDLGQNTGAFWLFSLCYWVGSAACVFGAYNHWASTRD